MKVMQRFVSAVLVIAILTLVCMSLSSCAGEEAVTRILETDPWYDTERIELDADFDPELYTDIMANGPWLIGDYFVMYYMAMERGTEETGYMSRMVEFMGIFDKAGNLKQKVDLRESIKDYFKSGSYFVLSFAEGEQGIRFSFYRLETTMIYYCDVDPETGLLCGEPVEFDYGSVSVSGQYVLYAKDFGGYEVILLSDPVSRHDDLVVGKDGKALYKVDFDAAFGPNGLMYVSDFYAGGEGKIFIEGFGKEHVMGSLDLATGELTKLTDVTPVSENQRISCTPDGSVYLTKATGIYDYSLDGEGECRLNFDNCNTNRYESQNAAVLYFDDTSAILGYNLPNTGSVTTNTETVVYFLEKAEKNPNAGKAVVTVASLSDSLSYFEGDALKAFNDQNQEYYAQLVLYDQNAYLTIGDSTEDIDKADQQRFSAMALASGSLIQDIRAGTGPDVIFGAAQSIDLLSSEYLLDLTPYLDGEDYNAADYYSNVVDASKIDGKAYFIPTAFTVAGIVTDGSKLSSSQVGFTYDEYSSFVYGQLNGVEPVSDNVSRMHFLSICIQSNYSKWIANGEVSFDTEEFRELAAFFKEQIPEGAAVKSDDGEVWSEEFLTGPEYKDAVFVESIDSLRSLASANFYGNNVKVVGLPSKDGTGLTANITNSFSIAQNTKVKDGAYALLGILLSKEVQEESREAIPVNRAAVQSKIDAEIYANEVAFGVFEKQQEYMQTSLDDLCREYGYFGEGSVIPDVFLEMLEGVDSIMLADNSVLMIVSEEIPPYLLGQKDLDSVISTIDSRVHIVFDER